MTTRIWWVRDDLRLHDNPALRAAAADGDVIAVRLDEEIQGARPPGGASRWWLHHSLSALSASLREHGVPLVLLSGTPRSSCPAWSTSRRRTPWSGIAGTTNRSAWSTRGSNNHCARRASRWKASRAVSCTSRGPSPRRKGPPTRCSHRSHAPAGMPRHPGARGAFPKISAARTRACAQRVIECVPGWRRTISRRLSGTEVGFPLLPTGPVFDDFAWREDEWALEAWQRGRTGIDLVDAGMRELWATGWMHNRVRLVVGSFLTKNLRLHWRHGEEWFWDTLVDADEASNPFNGQWVAGTGDDAAPYFRVFNPVRQQERLDPEGTYVSRWVAEAVEDGAARDDPIVDLCSTREDALSAYAAITRS